MMGAIRHIDRWENPVDAYATRVMSGEVPAGKYHRLACARHLADRAREGTPELPYRFEWDKAQRFFRFAGKMRHYKTKKWAGKYFEPSEAQVFRLGSIFGWRSADGRRRFTTAYNELPRKSGKALALDTPVPTPEGWKQHGDLVPGDRVFGPDGLPKRVEWVSEPHDGPCYRLTVSTGDSFVAHAAHEWVTRRTWYTGRPKGAREHLPPVETQRIAETLRCGERGDFVHRIDVTEPLDLPAADLPIPPYTLGAWLGDGTSVSGTLTVADVEIVERIRAEGVDCRPVSVKGAATLYRLDGQQGSQRSFTSQLRRIGVLGNKRIPAIYLRASREQRLEVLRGLVDTDGYVDPKGVYEIVSTHAELACDIRELAHTLGLKCTLRTDRAQLNGQDCGPRYRVAFSAHSDQVAALPRKQTSWAPSIARRSRGRTVIACEPCEPAQVNCIQVEGGVYLVGRDFVQTHNSFEAAIVALYVTFFEGEPGAEGYCIATKEKQARIVFEDAKRLVRSSGLTSRIEMQAKNLHRDDTASKLEPLGSDSDSTDGLNPHLIITDEFHAHKTRDLINVMESALGARSNPLHFQITTAGDDPVSPGGEQHEYACKILDGLLQDDQSTVRFFAFIASADVEDDPWAEATWRKANPQWGISVDPDEMREYAARAKQMSGASAEFKQKRLNLWVNSDHPWLSMEGWRAGQSEWSHDDLIGQVCYVGIDLASKIDLCAMTLAFPPTPERPAWRLIQYIWTPKGTLVERARRDRAPYQAWVDHGWLIAPDGTDIDHVVVVDALVEARERYQIEEVGFDPWHAAQVTKDLVRLHGFREDQLIAVPQTYAGMSAASLAFEADALAGKVDARGCPVTAWSASNAVVQRDGKDNIYPVKKRSRGRIDPIMSAIIARALHIRHEAAREPEYAVLIVGGGRR